MSRKVFEKGSRTYYNSSRFFPKMIREEVTKLYAFVRVVDDFVDIRPAKKNDFERWEKLWKKVWDGKISGIKIMDDFIALAKRKDFKKEWIESFFESMRFDIENKKCKNLEECVWYMHGSAEVIGFMMARIMNLPDKAMIGAKMLGRSFQYINFIRDFDEDNKLGRRYLEGVTEPKDEKSRKDFIRKMKKHIIQYLEWSEEARKSFRYLPYRYKIAIMTAYDMYIWTAMQIQKDPLVVFKKKIKPKKSSIILAGMKNGVKALWI